MFSIPQTSLLLKNVEYFVANFYIGGAVPLAAVGIMTALHGIGKVK